MSAEARPAQTAQLLALLREAGDEGVHTATIHRHFIVNASQRRQDLVDAGFNIEVGPRERSPYGPSMGVRYRLAAHSRVPIGVDPDTGQSFLIAEVAA